MTHIATHVFIFTTLQKVISCYNEAEMSTNKFIDEKTIIYYAAIDD